MTASAMTASAATYQPLDRDDGQPAQVLVTRSQVELDGRTYSSAKKPCDHAKNLKIALVVLAIIGLVVGVVGMLSYMGVLNIGLNGVGTLEGANALYTMLGGFGATLVATAIFTVLQLKARYNANKTDSSTANDMELATSRGPVEVYPTNNSQLLDD